MKEFIKTFCLRGLMAMGFGPLVYAIVMLILHLCNVDTTSDGVMIFKGILSTSLLAFLAAGATSIYKIERLGIVTSAVIHGVCLYIGYLSMYLLNGWLADNGESLLVFTIVFILGYLIIWLIVHIIERRRVKVFNSKL